jgi:hypothetical protein
MEVPHHQPPTREALLARCAAQRLQVQLDWQQWCNARQRGRQRWKQQAMRGLLGLALVAGLGWWWRQRRLPAPAILGVPAAALLTGVALKLRQIGGWLLRYWWQQRWQQWQQRWVSAIRQRETG